jgi:hypothetical protein
MIPGGSSIPEVEAPLAALVASKPNKSIAEIGTPFGAGALAIGGDVHHRPAAPERFAHAREALDGTRAGVLNPNWQDVLAARGAFELIFFDGGTDTRADTLNLVVAARTHAALLSRTTSRSECRSRGTLSARPFLEGPRLIGAELHARTDIAIVIASRLT